MAASKLADYLESLRWSLTMDARTASAGEDTGGICSTV
jgi:hypothetical protein